MESLLVVFEFMATLFLVVVGLGVAGVAALYILDVTQTQHAVRRNFPVVGRLRYILEDMGEFLRQYFFAMDREEMPFNRAERSYVYRAAKGVDTTVPFGSTRDLRPTGTIMFANSAYPPLSAETRPASQVIIGPYARQPYSASSVFHISAMSFGSISKPAIIALSNGARMAGVWLNTGEGGLSPHHLEGGADIVFQMGTAKYGVRDASGLLSEDRVRALAGHSQVKMIEIKLSQGAKPGKGGILPAAKVTPEIAAIRGIPAGVDSISPNRHPEVDSPEDLLDLIARVREASGLPVGFKTVIGVYGWLEDLCLAIRARGLESAPDFITIDSADGGTGAAPQSLMDYVGLPIKESLPLVVDILIAHGLKERIKVVASGKLINPAEVAWALCVGADFVNSARGFMFAVGCIQAMQCHQNTCPTGVTTHDPRLQRGLDPVDKAERVRRYAEHVNCEVEVIAHSCGVIEPRLLGRKHCRIVGADGRSRPLDELHPPPEGRLRAA